MSRLPLALVVCLALTAPGCKDKPTAPAPKPSAAETAPKHVHLDTKVAADAKIVLADAKRESLATTVDLPGETTSDPDKTAYVSTPVAGRIESVSFVEGTVVKKGDPLAVVRVPELGRLRAAHAGVVSRAKAARANADRLAGLRERGLAAEQERVDAQAQAEALEAESRALADQLAAMGMGPGAGGALYTLRAPIAGVAVARSAVVGQPVTEEQKIGTLADTSDLWFVARAFEKSLPRIAVGAHVHVALDAMPNEPIEGTVGTIGKQVDPTTRAITVRVRLAHPKGELRLGLFGIAHVDDESSRAPAAVVIPRSAIVEVDGASTVFVARGADEYEVRTVTAGATSGEKVAITAGVAEGERVVAQGAFTLKSVALKATFAEDEP